MQIYFVEYKYIFLNVKYFLLNIHILYIFIEYQNIFLPQISNHKCLCRILLFYEKRIDIAED